MRYSGNLRYISPLCYEDAADSMALRYSKWSWAIELTDASMSISDKEAADVRVFRYSKSPQARRKPPQSHLPHVHHQPPPSPHHPRARTFAGACTGSRTSLRARKTGGRVYGVTCG